MRSKNRASENTIPSTFYPGQITKSNSSKRRDDTEQAFITFHPQDQDKGLFDAVGDNVTIESCGEFKAIAKRILELPS